MNDSDLLVSGRSSSSGFGGLAVGACALIAAFSFFTLLSKPAYAKSFLGSFSGSSSNSKTKNMSKNMKLHYIPGTGSLSVRILANKVGVGMDFEKIQFVDGGKKTQDGRDFLTVNPLGYVPAVELPNGGVLTEAPAVLQYVADNYSYGDLIPQVKSEDRYKMLSMMNFVATEIHTAGIHAILSPSAKMPADAKPVLHARLQKNLGVLNDMLGDNAFFVGNKFSVMDIYVFVELNEIRSMMKLDLSGFKNLDGFMARMMKDEVIVKSMKDEGLIS